MKYFIGGIFVGLVMLGLWIGSLYYVFKQGEIYALESLLKALPPSVSQHDSV